LVFRYGFFDLAENMPFIKIFLANNGRRRWKPDIFCLRIDADELTPGSFGAYYPLYEKYHNALTIFFNGHHVFYTGCQRQGQSAFSRADFQNRVFGLETGKGYDSVADARIHQKILTQPFFGPKGRASFQWPRINQRSDLVSDPATDVFF